MFASLSEGEQRLEAIVGLIQGSTVPALGALADAAAKGATKSTELDTKLEDLQITLGKDLEPILTDLTETAIDLLPVLAGVTRVVGAQLGPLSDLTREMREASDAGWGWSEANEALGSGARFLAESLNVVNFAARFTAEALFGAEESAFDAARAAQAATDRWQGLADSMAVPILGQVGIAADPKLTGAAPAFSARNAMTGAKIISHVNTGDTSGRRTVRHGGGVVPGRQGQQVNATLQAGERVISAHGGGGGGVVINVQTGVSSPQDVARAIVDLLQEYNRNQGAVPIEVRNAEGIVT